MRTFRVLRRLLFELLTAVAATLVVMTAGSAPAFAHSDGPPKATNYRSEIVSIGPRVEGVKLRVANLDEEMELTNRSDRDVTVLGYDGEPYLRVGPAGTFVNTRSPAYYLNRTAEGETRPPPDADPAGEPRWSKLASSRTVHWHDHRAHWMEADPPPLVRADPDERHVIYDAWKLELRHGVTPLLVTGTLTWEPGPESRLWYALIGFVALLSTLVTLPHAPRSRAVMVGVFGLLLCTGVVGVVDELTAMTGSIVSRIGSGLEAVMPALVGLIIGIYGLARTWKRSSDGPWYLLFSSLTLGVVDGVSRLDALAHSQIATVLPVWMARSTVALGVGLGVGLTFASLIRIRATRSSQLTTPD